MKTKKKTKKKVKKSNSKKKSKKSVLHNFYSKTTGIATIRTTAGHYIIIIIIAIKISK